MVESGGSDERVVGAGSDGCITKASRASSRPSMAPISQSGGSCVGISVKWCQKQNDGVTIVKVPFRLCTIMSTSPASSIASNSCVHRLFAPKSCSAVT